MVNIYSLHGWGSSPNDDFFPWLKKEIELNGYGFVAPHLPERYLPDNNLISTLDNIIGRPNKNDYFIGHSAGAHLFLRYCEYLSSRYSRKVEIGGMILVAPFQKVNFKAVKAGIIQKLLNSNDEQAIENSTEIIDNIKKVSDSWGKTPIYWEKIRGVSPNNICLFSTDDPFIFQNEHSIFEKALMAEIRIFKNAGHFNLKDGFDTFEDLSDILFNMISKNNF